MLAKVVNCNTLESMHCGGQAARMLPSAVAMCVYIGILVEIFCCLCTSTITDSRYFKVSAQPIIFM